MYSCTICVHPDREAIEAELLAGQSLRAVARQHANTSKDSLSRHLAHVPPEQKRAAAASVNLGSLAIADRLHGIADDASDARAKLLDGGRYREAARLADLEVRALGVLADRLDVRDLGQLEQARQLQALTAALRSVLSVDPSLVFSIATELAAEGYDDLAAQLRAVVQRDADQQQESALQARQRAVELAAAPGASVDTSGVYVPAKPLPADREDLPF